jgi:hypothetical protein
MLRVGKQPLVGRSTGSPTLKEAARETSRIPISVSCQNMQYSFEKQNYFWN